MARVQFTIRNRTGETETEVLDRQEGENCDNIKLTTQQMGVEVGDEITGPRCDEVHEGQI